MLLADNFFMKLKFVELFQNYLILPFFYTDVVEGKGSILFKFYDDANFRLTKL